ncbi:YlbF family regulator [Bacillus suaedaesalsae]|uniref:YlbF family regulator n=1 Tax=Bacillus suaedaesalsae TaxID=2810349 RepID=A0ABS2DJA1_9BACI|nr:YlbF family regulator [Bacillus suaedaesalsae]MBM6618577.1 YlbF family regulator [Bacillus suaedaesalsae]
MLATLERVELLEEAELLARMVIQSDVAEQYRTAYYLLHSNQEAQNLIKRFVHIKERYEEVQRFGKYHPDYKEINLETRYVKREVDLHPVIANFKKAEKDLQELLDEISVLIGKAVSEYIKVPTGNPFFDSMSSCSTGGCGSGGSCGCK